MEVPQQRGATHGSSGYLSTAVLLPRLTASVYNQAPRRLLGESKAWH